MCIGKKYIIKLLKFFIIKIKIVIFILKIIILDLCKSSFCENGGICVD